MAVETGIPPDRLAEMDAAWLDAMSDVLVAKAKAMSGEDDDEVSLDWDAMHPDDVEGGD